VVDVGVAVRVTLHLPVLPALKIAWISEATSGQLNISTSSISPDQNSTACPTEFMAVPIHTGETLSAIDVITTEPGINELGTDTPSTYSCIDCVVMSKVAATCCQTPQEELACPSVSSDKHRRWRLRRQWKRAGEINETLKEQRRHQEWWCPAKTPATEQLVAGV